MKTLMLFLALNLLTFHSIHLQSQDSKTKTHIKLWPASAPGESKPKAPPVISDNASGNVTRLSEVTDPLLEVFEPVNGNTTGLGIVVCPGGGYNILAINHEGYEIAAWLNRQGITAFVLQYRVPQKKDGALQDAQRAIRLARKLFSLQEPLLQKIGIMGFSAGGSLSARASTRFNEQTYDSVDEADQLSCRPDFSLLIYPAYLDQGQDNSLTPELTLSDQTPPMFITETADDPYGNSALVMAQALRNAKIEVELHFLPKGGHGYGVRPGNPAGETWPALAEKWLKQLISPQLLIQSSDEIGHSLIKNRHIPFVQGDSVLFLYQGEAGSVAWAGDFNGWKPDDPAYQGSRIEGSDLWYLKASFPKDARLDYKIVTDNNWILDPANPKIQWSGMGPNSELRMPDWKPNDAAIPKPGIPKGQLSDPIILHSQKLGYDISFTVYLPNLEYSILQIQNPKLKTLYVTDGHEYADDKKGALVTILDNLIFEGTMDPVIAVFIDPRDPADREKNRRMQELICSQKFSGFVAEELVPYIEKSYPAHSSPDSRAILGTSLGGLNAGWFGVNIPETFHLIAIQSPSYNKTIQDLYQKNEKLPLKIFMSTGVIHDTQDNARSLRDLFTEKGYPLKYIEVNEGHSWGNWKGVMDDLLICFFSESKNEE